jgi:GMP synthase-like glutamine amidotransferase
MTRSVGKPVAIVQHEADVAPGYFAHWLESQGIAATLIRIHVGDPVPADPLAFSGLCFMGGTMSVNDPLPFIAKALELIRRADAAAVPVIGHCLGGQLLARALGGAVRRNPVKEIGWSRLTVTDAALAHDWLGVEVPEVEMFQWHGDTFDLPPGAANFLSSGLCARQAFVVARNGFAHLGMQFHCEMTPQLVQRWIADPDAEPAIVADRGGDRGPGVQSDDEILRDLPARTERMNRLAAQLYSRWWRGVESAAGGRRAAA